MCLSFKRNMNEILRLIALYRNLLRILISSKFYVSIYSAKIVGQRLFCILNIKDATKVKFDKIEMKCSGKTTLICTIINQWIQVNYFANFKQNKGQRIKTMYVQLNTYKQMKFSYRLTKWICCCWPLAQFWFVESKRPPQFPPSADKPHSGPPWSQRSRGSKREITELNSFDRDTVNRCGPTVWRALRKDVL